LNRKSNGIGIDDPRTVLRNKIAFLKNKGIIMKEQEFEIGYKRTESNNLNSNRVILYFNNKSNRSKIFNVSYSAEP
jgi:glutamine synthetase